MAQATLEVKGFEDLFKAMEELQEEIGKAKTDRIWKNALTYAFVPVLEKAKSLAPVDTGQLRDNLYIKAQRPQARDKRSIYYAGESYMVRVTLRPQREESIKNTVLTKKGKFKDIFQNRPVGVSQEFGNARTAAHPFLRPALESNVENVTNRLGQAIWAELNWGKYAKG
jgi:HK97 gp10 family phage protein